MIPLIYKDIIIPEYEILAREPIGYGYKEPIGMHYGKYGSVYYSSKYEDYETRYAYKLNDNLSIAQRVAGVRATGRNFLWGEEADLAIYFFPIPPQTDPSTNLFYISNNVVITGLEWRKPSGTDIGFTIAQVVVATGFVVGGAAAVGLLGGGAVATPTGTAAPGVLVAENSVTPAAFGESFTGQSLNIATLSSTAEATTPVVASAPSFFDTVSGYLKTGLTDVKSLVGAAGAVKGLTSKPQIKTPSSTPVSTAGPGIGAGLLALLGGGLMLLLIL